MEVTHAHFFAQVSISIHRFSVHRHRISARHLMASIDFSLLTITWFLRKEWTSPASVSADRTVILKFLTTSWMSYSRSWAHSLFVWLVNMERFRTRWRWGENSDETVVYLALHVQTSLTLIAWASKHSGVHLQWWISEAKIGKSLNILYELIWNVQI